MSESIASTEDEIYGSDNSLPETLAELLKLRHAERIRANIRLAAVFGSIGIASAAAGVVASLYRPKHT